MRVDTLSTNFSGGELSPRLYGRPDLAKYGDSLKQARDIVIFQHGGFRGRPGTDLLGEVKESSKRTRLIPFVYSVLDAYMLEFGDGYMRVWKNGALVAGPYELTIPYATAELFEIDYTQGADTMFLAIQSRPIYRLRRFADNHWTIDQAPFSPAPFSEIGRRQASAITLGATTGSTTATALVDVFLASDVGRVLAYSGGQGTITGVSDAQNATITITQAFTTTALPASGWVLSGSPRAALTPGAEGPVGEYTTLVLSADGWRADDIGRYVTVNGGLIRIIGIDDAQNADGVIEAELTGTTQAPVDAWALESPVWNASDGYPRTVTLHQQRLVAGGTPSFPQTFWGSRSGLYFDFTKGVRDDDSYSHELGSDEINPIRFLNSTRELVVLTYGGEWTINGGIEKPITPTNVRAIPQAKVGCSDVRSEQIDDDLYYIQRGNTMVRTLGWNAQFGGYQSSEASTFSEHIVRDGIENITYQQSPERVAWLMRPDGKYVSMTVSREQNIRPFTLCTPAGDGVVESMATIPEGGEDRTYMIVRRTINGQTKRYVERMNWDARQDCRVERSPGGSAVVSDLEAFEGKTVAAVADGVDLGDFTVADGEVTLQREAEEVSVGFRFVPTAKLLTAEVGTGMGVSAGGKKQTGRVRVLFKDTVGCTINGQPLPFRQFGDEVLDQPVPPYTGWKEVSEFGWEIDSDENEISQPQCYHIEVLAVVRRITANPG